MTNSEISDEIDQFGLAAKVILDLLFPDLYEAVILIDPSFDIQNFSNIGPQFRRGDFFAVASVETPIGLEDFRSDASRFSPVGSIDELLEYYRHTNAIFASTDLSVLTAWAQGDYAVVAFRRGLMSQFKEWFESMMALGVLRELK